VTFSRMSEAFAVQMKGLGFLIVFVDVVSDAHDELFEILERLRAAAGFVSGRGRTVRSC
jgi:hypothetical protein